MNNKYLHQINSKTSKTSLSGKYLIIFAMVITSTGIIYSYSIAMTLLIAFTLAYLTKGFRRI
ncbi:MAG: hypothetical protein HC930_01210 [Hydrococcus sp. SU_1_0]|nr:hypothetical protein [Hydrococcus sp. SU_1_0]